MSRALAAVLLMVPGMVHAQAGALRIEGAGQPESVPAVSRAGYAAYPVTALAPLGARVEDHARGARVVLFGDTLDFLSLSPFFTADGRVQQLAYPAYRDRSAFYLPHQFFVEWLPARHADRVEYRDGLLRLRRDVAAAAAAPAAQDPPTGAARSAEAETRVVVIDPGHGGRDPGAVGRNGIREKDIVLAVGMRLAAMLRERGYEVHLTRTRDTLIALEDRAPMANKWKNGRPAALFLSIHTNAASRRAVGFETFFLSEARTEDERRVAEMENAAVAYQEDRNGQAVPDIDFILNNLRNDFYLRASNALAEVVQQRLARVHPGPNRGVKQAGLWVLVDAFMPAVLVELAFITSPTEVRMLASSAFQQNAAGALADAVDAFFAGHEHLWSTEASR